MTLLALVWLKLLVLAVLLAEVSSRIGLGFLAFLMTGPRTVLSRFGLGVLFGWGALGMAFLGFACVGLFYPFVLALVVLVALAASRAARSRRILVWDAAREWIGLGYGAWGVTALGAFVVVHALLTPVMGHDSYLYHLGVPWQYLQAHRAVLTESSWTFHYPLLLEMPFTLSLLLGDDRLVKWMVVLSFACANAVFAGACIARGRRNAAWLGPLLALSVKYIFQLITQSKNDMAASSLFITGAMLYAARGWVPGALLLGLSMAAKLTHAPLVAVWVALQPPPKRMIPLILAALALPLMPWWGKTWLATGNPLYPFASGLFPSFDWSAAQEVILRNFLGETGETGVLKRLAGIPGAWWGHMKGDYLTALLVLPGLFLPRGPWRPALICVIAQAATLAVGHNPRYLLPSVWYLGLLAATSVESLPGSWRKAAVWGLAGIALAHSALALSRRNLDWKRVTMLREEFWAHKLTTYEETVLALKKIKPSRILLMGERLVYRLPGRVLYGGQIGETPLVWKLVHESDSQERVRIKFRQLGVSHTVFNYVSSKWLPDRYAPFAWDKRMLDIYKGFWKAHHEVLWRSSVNNFSSGGHYVFRMRYSPLDPAPQVAWFLPGTEQLYATSMLLASQFKYEELLKVCQRAHELLPDIGHSWNEVGQTYSLLRNSSKAYEYLKKFGDMGMVDEINYAEYGSNARRLGRFLQAERLLQAALKYYPDQRRVIQLNLAQLRAYAALVQIDQGKTKEAGTLLEEAGEYLEEVDAAMPRTAANEFYLESKAAVIAVRGQLALTKGDRRQAAELFRQASETTPDLARAKSWKRVADELAPRVFMIGGEKKE